MRGTSLNEKQIGFYGFEDPNAMGLIPTTDNVEVLNNDFTSLYLSPFTAVNLHDIVAEFLYCCSDCPNCMAH